MSEQVLLKTGNGRSIHIAAERNSEEERYRTLCGAEKCSTGRRWASSVWIHYKSTQATCKKCLAAQEVES